jgi:hypothetical protein
MLIAFAPQADPRFAHRADPAYWHPAYEQVLRECRYPLRPLGEFISHLTYGPIITRAQPPLDPSGVALVHQGQIAEAGVDLRAAVRIVPGCPWDRPAARLQPGDLVLARSGMGSLARNRLAVFLEDTPAVVGSFVDLIRLEGLEPIYVALYLKSAFGWSQIHRLTNGVALPNVSFDEIRALQVALASAELQQEAAARYRAEVLPAHRADPSAAREAFRRLMGWLQGRLSRADSPSPIV